ncbi:MAG TPA: class I adenylate-forming enzyme family protein [Polyangia bacterium]
MPLIYDWLQRIVKEQGGSGTALVYRDTYLSWRGLSHRVDRRAQELASFGIGPGAWLGVMLGNVPEFVILAAAASKLGAVFVPLDPVTASRELDMILEATPLWALITRPHGGDSPTPTPPSPQRTDAKNRPPRFQPESRRRLQGTLLNVHIYKRAPVDLPDDFAGTATLFTSDTGGDPKGVVRTDAQLDQVADTIATALSLSPEERLLSAVPLHQGFGFDAGLLAPLSRGVSLYLEDELSIKRLGKLLRDEHIEVFPGNPAVFSALAREVTVKPLTTKKPRFLSAGAALPSNTAQAFFERYRVRILSTYHSTEAGPISIDRTGKEPATVGKPFEGIDLRLGAATTEGDAGEPRPVWVRSAGTSTFFLPRLSLTAPDGSAPIGRLDQEGWLRTGDLGTLDRSGRLTLAGREDDLVKIDGKRVALGEVAGCLEGFAKVKEAEAHLAYDEVGNPIVIARVVASAGCRVDELMDHCARNLAPHKVPRQIEIGPSN